MSDFSGRLFQVARAYLDTAKERLSEIDARAQEELDKALTHDDIKSGLASSDDPMARAQAKINAARPSAYVAKEAAPIAPTDPVQTAYKIIGVPNGTDYLTVQTAVNKLRDRCNPSRFPNASREQTEARQILQRVEDAFRVLQSVLDPGSGRFDKLEI